MKKFSGVARVTSFARDLGRPGKTTAQSSIRKVNDLSIAAGKEASIRLKNVGAVMKERAREVPSKLAEGAIRAGRVVDETFTNMKKVLSNFMPAPEFAFAGGAVKESIENTHVTVNAVKYMVSKIEGLNIGGKGANTPPAFKQTEFASSYKARINQTPAEINPSIQFEGTRGESLAALKPPPDPKLKQILD